MDATSLWLTGAVLSGAAGGVGIGTYLAARKNCPRLSQSVSDIFGESSSSFVAWRLRNGIQPALPLARALLKITPLKACAEEAVWELRLRSLETTDEALASCFVVAVFLLGLVVLLFSHTVLAFIAVPVCIAVVAVLWSQSLAQKRKEAMRTAIPDALRSMSVCFQSGLTLLQTFQHISEETTGPLSTLFRHAAHRMEIGESATDALEALRSDTTVSELAFVAVALDAQHQSGGSLRHVLDSARESVESELELKQKLQVQTAQANLSARVVCALPFVLLAVFSVISEGFLDPFFESIQGLILLGVAFGMQIAGIVTVRKMLNVEDLS